MTTLLIQTETIPLTVNLPALVQMTDKQFYEFCQAKAISASNALPIVNDARAIALANR